MTPTKLKPPRLRAGLVRRPELVGRLREGRDRALTLVSAPAGYGKTTLLAQWHAKDRTRRPFSWIAFDGTDSDPVRLWSDVIAGLQETDERLGTASMAALSQGPHAISEAALPLLVEDLAESGPRVIILEDWEVVRNPLCDRTLGWFVEHAPTEVQIVVSSRSDPGLPIARLRANGDLAEVRASDLQLSASEAGSLLGEAGIQLEDREIERLVARIEGWPAGLALAVLALRERRDHRGFVDAFSGDNRYVFDYLAREVLDGVEPGMHDFMLRSSVLTRLSAPLCDAVLETSGSATMLDEIERSNLFLVALDETGSEYRYHHLFAATLKRELQSTDPAAVPRLHARASEWFEAEGDVDAAIEHAIACRDVARASALVIGRAQALFTSGRVATVARWLASLDWTEATADPQLALIRAQLSGQSGRPRDEIEHWLGVAEAGALTGPLANRVASADTAIALMRSAYLTRGLRTAEREARRTLELEPPESPWRATALNSLGQALYLLGRTDDARAPLEEARAHHGAAERTPAAALGLSYLALIALDQGDGTEAERAAREAVALVETHHLDSGIVAANPHLALGSVLSEGTDLHTAIAHLERAVVLSAPAGSTYWHAHALLRLAVAQHRLGDDEAARETLDTARAELDRLPDLGMLGPLHEEAEGDLLHRRRREGYLGDGLSDAELRVLRRLVLGYSVADVARELWLSPNTVKSHRRSIYRKLGVTRRAELLERTDALLLLEGHPGDEPVIVGPS
ncbi:MAG TPA: LuxR C-terminal-related transcriptional regulator [Gaiellaceae bacterium]|nr:LuxR C-terminal-related transcriptional regulator [Gaiellaceae bacterium]